MRTVPPTNQRSVRWARPAAACRRLRVQLRREDGVAMIEFAIVLPVLLMIVFGIFSFGLFLNDTIDATHLASEGARLAAVNSNPGSPSTLQSYLLAQASPDVKNNGHVYIYYPSGSTGAVGQAVRVCVTTNFQFMPLLGLTTTQVTETSTMRVEAASTGNWTADSSPPAQCPTS